jgi:hypothetical protein
MAELSVVARRGKGDIESCAAVFIRTVSGRKCSWCLELRRAKQVDPTVLLACLDGASTNARQSANSLLARTQVTLVESLRSFLYAPFT